MNLVQQGSEPELGCQAQYSEENDYVERIPAFVSLEDSRRVIHDDNTSCTRI